MRADSPGPRLLSGHAGWVPVLTSRLGGRALADNIPILSGSAVAVADAEIPERLSFTVPEWADGMSWVPESADHPLAKYGQTIEATIMVRSLSGEQEFRTRIGQYRVQEWAFDDDGNVQVTALGVLCRAKRARFRVPEVPRVGGTFASEFRRLMVPGVPVSIDPSLVDRPIPQSFLWEQDRLAALYEIADAWPARVRTDQYGTVRVLPVMPLTPSPVVELTDGVDGTLVSAPRSDTAEGVYNVVVGQASNTDSPAREAVTAVAEITSGPLAVNADGTGFGESVRYVSSPLTTTYEEVLAMARTTRDAEQRKATVRSVTCAPDSRIELDDPIGMTRNGRREVGYVVGYELPLTIDDGDMRVDVGVSA